MTDAAGPVPFGRMLDRGQDGEVFLGIAACWELALLSAWRVAGLTARHAR